MPPFFSIAIPTLNRVDYLRRTVESVLAQDFPDFEVFVLDNGSEDATPDFLASVSHPRFRWGRNETHLPMPVNWNTALRSCRGEWLYLFEDDDLMSPHTLSTVHKAIQQFPSARAACWGFRWMDEQDKVIDEWFCPESLELVPAPQGFWRFARDWRLAPPGFMIHRSAYEAVGGYNEELPFSSDPEFLLRVLLIRDVVTIPQRLCSHRRWGGTVTMEVWRGPKEIETTCGLYVSLLSSLGRQEPHRLPEGKYVLGNSFVEPYLIRNCWRLLSHGESQQAQDYLKRTLQLDLSDTHRLQAEMYLAEAEHRPLKRLLLRIVRKWKSRQESHRWD